MEITKWHIPKRINNPQAKIKPVGIILHYVGNPHTSARANAKYFHEVNRQVSANYVVDDTHIYEIIPPDMKSFGTSSGLYNGQYIQIEMCHPDNSGYITDATLERVVWLCRRLIDDYGCDKVIRHYDVTGKKCPLWYVEHYDDWEKLKKRILTKEEAVTMDNKPSEWAKEAVQWAVDNGIMRGDEKGNLRLRDNVTREELAVMLYRALGK